MDMVGGRDMSMDMLGGRDMSMDMVRCPRR